jgi:hypothetical protein
MEKYMQNYLRVQKMTNNDNHEIKKIQNAQKTLENIRVTRKCDTFSWDGQADIYHKEIRTC